MEEKQDLKIEELKSLYSSVLESFPEIRPEGLRLEYNRLEDRYACISILNEHGHKDPVVLAGGKFMYLDDAEKEAVFAHELGHYCRMKNYSVERLKRISAWVFKSSYYEAADIIASNKVMRKAKRLQKWNMLQESYADKRATEAGYGKDMVKLLEKHYSQYYKMLQHHQREEIETRIRNLKKLLGEKDDR